MAIDPSAAYSGQVADPDAEYPYGKARNRPAPGLDTGTPFEEKWLNDLWGFFQRILSASGTTPSNTPDTATDSQYYSALRLLIHALQNGESITVGDGTSIKVLDSGLIQIQSDGHITVYDGGHLNMLAGAAAAIASGASFNFGNATDLTCAARTTFKDFGPACLKTLSFSDSAPPELRIINDLSDVYAKFQAKGGGCQLEVTDVPQLAVATGVVIKVQGDPGAHGALPGDLPELHLYRRDTNGNLTLVDSEVDPSTTHTEYETIHEIAITGLTAAVRNGSGILEVVLKNEGTAGVAGLRVYNLNVAWELSHFIGD
jgi:hypothetical protein